MVLIDLYLILVLHGVTEGWITMIYVTSGDDCL